MLRTLRFISLLALTFLIILSSQTPIFAQSSAGRVAFGAHGGLAKYWGSFTDDQFWFGGDAFLRWNIIDWISLHAQYGVGQLRYKTTDQNQVDYFGPSPHGATYPGTTIPLEEKNSIRYSTFAGFVSWNITPKQSLVPYVFVGVGTVNFEPQVIGSSDFSLPNNAAGRYKKSALFIPVGAGFEAYLSDDFTINLKAQVNLTQTDFLDDYEDLPAGSTSNDAFATFTFGLSYYIFGSLDCDDDGLTDNEERRIGSDPCNPDTDGDKLGDFEEVRTLSTDPTKADTDDDGLNDFDEVRVHTTNPRSPDTDNDGLKDGDEIARKTDPKNPDSDGDGLTDGDEVNKHRTDPTKADTDGDALRDGEEITVHATNPTAADTDSDGLNDGAEVNTHKTNPKAADSDGDALKDGDEVNQYKTNPLKPDTDNDKLSDGEEVNRVKTNPLNPDTDADKVIDGDDRCPLVAGVPERDGCPAPPKVGTITNFPDIFFIVNTDQFDFSRPETDENLAKLLSYINQCPGLAVIIEGHASREGNEKRNQELSDMRANRVKQWLIERGATAGKVEATIGFGSRKNSVQEPDPKSAAAKKMNQAELESIRKQNRRIAVKVARTCD